MPITSVSLSGLVASDVSYPGFLDYMLVFVLMTHAAVAGVARLGVFSATY